MLRSTVRCVKKVLSYSAVMMPQALSSSNSGGKV
ncbi:Uncharacterised protein [Vibrio cholerae]|nr:Uncharacterised protein [Vibrio cholerae]